MNDFLDIEPILDDWLTEGVDMWPDRSIDAVLATVQRTSQRRAWRVPWRTYEMTGFTRMVAILGAAAIVALLVGGAALVGSQRAPAAPTTVPAAVATTSPSPATTSVPSLTATPVPRPLGMAIVGLDGTVRQESDLPRSAWAPDLAPDGSRVAYVDGGRLWIADVGPGTTPVDTGAAVSGTVPGFGTFPIDVAPAWSPDGTMIAYSSGGDIYVLTVGSQAAPRRLTTDPAIEEWPAWWPDGRTIYFVNEGATPLDQNALSPTQEIWRVAAIGGTPHRVTRDDVTDVQPDIAGDRSMLVWVDGGVSRLDPATDKVSAVTNPLDGSTVALPDSWNPRLSPDGKRLALLAFNGARVGPLDPSMPFADGLPLMDVVVVDLTTGNSTPVGPRVAAFWNPVSWTPDSSALLINRIDNGS